MERNSKPKPEPNIRNLSNLNLIPSAHQSTAEVLQWLQNVSKFQSIKDWHLNRCLWITRQLCFEVGSIGVCYNLIKRRNKLGKLWNCNPISSKIFQKTTNFSPPVSKTLIDSPVESIVATSSLIQIKMHSCNFQSCVFC